MANEVINTPSKEAIAWQGYDDYVGVDKYEDVYLESGTKLVKLPSRSGYFTTLEAYGSLKKEETVSSKELSQGLQVAPWRNINTGDYEYRDRVVFYEIKKRILVARGESTLANSDFGKGKLPQIYIPGYDGNEKLANQELGVYELREENGIQKSENLEDRFLSVAEWKEIQSRHEQHIKKRNLMLYNRAKDNFLELKSEETKPEIRKHCDEQIRKIDERIVDYKRDIDKLRKLNENVKSQTYDPVNKYLKEKTEKELNFGENEKLEQKTKEIHENIIGKIREELQKDEGKRRIKIDELLKAYRSNQFYRLSKERMRLEELIRNAKEIEEKLKRIDQVLDRGEKTLYRAKQNLKLLDDEGPKFTRDEKSDEYIKLKNEYEKRKPALIKKRKKLREELKEVKQKKENEKLEKIESKQSKMIEIERKIDNERNIDEVKMTRSV